MTRSRRTRHQEDRESEGKHEKEGRKVGESMNASKPKGWRRLMNIQRVTLLPTRSLHPPVTDIVYEY